MVYELAFAPEHNRRAWSLGAPDKPNTGIGLVPFTKKVLWDCLAVEKDRADSAAAFGLKVIQYNSLGFTSVSQRGPQHHSGTMWEGGFLDKDPQIAKAMLAEAKTQTRKQESIDSTKAAEAKRVKLVIHVIAA